MSFSTLVLLNHVGLIYHELTYSAAIPNYLVLFIEAIKINTLFYTTSSQARLCNIVLTDEKSEVHKELLPCLHAKTKLCKEILYLQPYSSLVPRYFATEKESWPWGSAKDGITEEQKELVLLMTSLCRCISPELHIMWNKQHTYLSNYYRTFNYWLPNALLISAESDLSLCLNNL